MRTAAWVLILAGLALSMGCESAYKVSDKQIEPIETKDLRRLMRKQQERLKLVDVRRQELYEQGHIPGAIHIPVQEARSNDPRLSEAKTIVVYGNDWQDDLPRVMAKRLMILGYKNIYLYTAGYEAYQRAVAG